MNLKNIHLHVAFSISPDGLPELLCRDHTGTLWSNSPLSFLLDVRTRSGGIHKTKRLHLESQAVDTEGDAQRLTCVMRPVFEPSPDTPDIRLTLHYTLQAHAPQLSEQLEIQVCSTEPVYLHRAHWGWRLKKRPGLSWVPVPFGEGHGSHAPTLLTDAASGKSLRRDGAVLHDSKSERCLVMAKTPSDRDPEYVVVQNQSEHLAFSGFSPDPSINDCSACLNSGHYLSAPTFFEVVEGSLERGLIAHRQFMERHGIGLPEHYDPPLNYCIYYECKNSWTREQVQQLLPVASELGCTLLYTDQGWETSFGTGIWDEARLGSCRDFVSAAAALGLQVGVLVSLHASKPSWPDHVYRRSPQGSIEDGDRWHPYGICAGSRSWQEEKTKRLATLVEEGVRFFSFDFNDTKDYQGYDFRPYPCFSKEHAHSHPMTEWEHIQAVAAQQRAFRQLCPSALVEAHDWALAGDSSLPTYLFPESCQERWGFEYMWNPFADLQAGRLQNLYYYNLAYTKPLYLHLDLKNDQPEHLTAFWYLASTIRHLGIGNFTALPPDHQARVHQALTVYLRHRTYFTRGQFFGSSPCVHVHALPGQGAVVACFNDSAEPKDVSAVFTPGDLGLETPTVAGAPETLWGPEIRVSGHVDGLSFHTTLPAWGVALIRLPASPRT